MTSGIIFDIKRYALHDGPGIRTTVFLKGCPLRCRWCHNPEGIDPHPALLYRADRCLGCGACRQVCPTGAAGTAGMNGGGEADAPLCRRCGRCAEVCPSLARELVGRRYTVEQVLDEVLSDRPFYETSGGGLTLSGGEPLAQPDFTLALLEAARRAGLSCVLDTSGFAPGQVLLAAARLSDLVLYDLKQMDPEAHRRATGVDNSLILHNLERLSRVGVPIRIRLPLIPGENDDGHNLEQTGRFAARLDNVQGIDLIPFHAYARSKYQLWGLTWPFAPEPPTGTVDTAGAARRLQEMGLTVAWEG